MLFFITCFTFTDYGITWDEIIQKDYGYRVLLWYSSFFQDHSAIANVTNNTYGGFFESIAQFFSYLVVLFTSSNFFETRHFINAIFGLIGIITAYNLGCLLSGSMGGFFAALFLAITPRFYGHMFNNSKDIPFATLFLISIYYIIKFRYYLPRIPMGLILKIGVAIGCTLGIRIGGIFLFGYLGLSVILWYIYEYNFKKGDRIKREELDQIVLSLFIAFAIAWMVMLIWWPWAQISPFINPINALVKFSNFPWKGLVLFKGEFVAANNLPKDYLPTWFLITLPEFYFISLLCGLVISISYFRKFKMKIFKLEKSAQIFLIIFSIFFPLIVVILKRSVLYDGLRHFLFIIPPIAVLSGISFAEIMRKGLPCLIKFFLGGVVFISIGITIFDMIDLHPYQSVFFNRLAGGGLKKASLKFETDYWGSSYKEGAEWLKENYGNNSEQKISVATCFFPPKIIFYYLNREKYLKKEIERACDLFHIQKNKAKFLQELSQEDPKYRITPTKYADVLIAYTRWNCHKSAQGDVLFKVTRKNTPLLYVIRIRDIE